MRVVVFAVLLAAAHAQGFSGTEMSVFDGSVNEVAPSTWMTFQATFLHNLSPTNVPVPTVRWRTEQADTANAAIPGADYVSVTNGDLTFASSASGTNVQFSVRIVNDNFQEGDEVFGVQVFAATGTPESSIVFRNDGRATGTIGDDEGLTVSISGDRKLEGQDSAFSFDVTLSHQVDTEFKISYNTVEQIAPGYAEANFDYLSRSGTLTFPALAQQRSFEVPIENDDLQERVETFEVAVQYVSQLEAQRPVSFVPANGRAIATFDREFEGVTVCVGDQSMNEGDASTMAFTVSLSHQVDTDVTINMRTVAGVTNVVTGAESAISGAAVNFNGPLTTHYFDSVLAAFFPRRTITNQVMPVTVHNDNVQSRHSHASNLQTFGQVNFGVEYAIPFNVWQGSTGGAANDFQLRGCNSGEQINKASGYIYDFEGVTMSISDATARQEASTQAGFEWVFTVSLSHQVIPDGAARGAQFTFNAQNTPQGSASNYYANVERFTPASGCASIPEAADRISTPDVCWPVGVYPTDGSIQGSVQTFDSGTTAGSAPTQTFMFAHGPIDNILEGTETFEVAIELGQYTGTAGYRVSFNDFADSTGVGTIFDDQVAQFIFTPSTPITLAENNQNLTFQYDVELRGIPGKEITYVWETIDGSATGGVDFQNIPQSVLTWPAGSTDVQTASIPIINDNLQELSETFSVVFHDPKPMQLFPGITVPETIVATISDDEGMTVSITSMSDAQAQDESAPTWLFTASLSHAVSVDTSVPWSTQMATSFPAAEQARMGLLEKFSFQSGMLNFPGSVGGQGGPASTALSVVVQNDNIQQFTTSTIQHFLIVLGTQQVPLISAAAQATADQTVPRASEGVVAISDNESPTIWLSDAEGNEEDGSRLSFSVYFSHQITTDVEISYHTVDGPSTQGAISSGNALQGTSDFASQASPRSLIVSQLSLVSPQAAATIDVSILNDFVQEQTETFMLMLNDTVSSPVNSGFGIMPLGGLGTIFDSEGLSVSVGSVTQAEVTGFDPWYFTVMLSHRTSVSFDFSYDLSSGSALVEPASGAAGSLNIYDVGYSPSTVQLGGFDANGDALDTGVITVDVFNDNVQEPIETFNVFLREQLSPVDVQAILASQPGVGTITDNEGATLSISDSFRSKADTPLMPFTVQLSHQVSEDLIVSYSTAPGSASAVATTPSGFQVGDFYEVSSNSLTFSGSNQRGTYDAVASAQLAQVSLFQDQCIRDSQLQTFSVNLASANDFATFSQGTGVGTVEDIQSATVTILPTSTVEGSNMVFTVQLSHCVVDNVYVDWSVSPGTAGVNVQYAVPPGSNRVMFPALDGVTPSEQTFTIQTLNNNIQGVDTEFTATIRNGPAPFNSLSTYNISIAQATVPASIQDFEDATLSVTQCVAHQDDEVFIFTVSLSHPVTTDISVTVATANNTALSGIDFVPLGPITTVFPAFDNTAQTFAVTALARNNTFRPNPAGLSADASGFVRFDFDVVTPAAEMALYNLGFANNDSVGKGVILGDVDSTIISMTRVTGQEQLPFLFEAVLRDTISTPVVVRATPMATGSFDSAIPNHDFDNASILLNFVANGGPNQPQRFSVPVIDDWLTEGTEKFDVMLEVVSPASLKNLIDTVTNVEQGHEIFDNDNVGVTVLDAQQSESATQLTSEMIFTVLMTHSVAADVTVDLTVSADTATQSFQEIEGTGSNDFYLNPSLASSVTFPGTPRAGRPVILPSETYSVVILNDNVQEMAETLTVQATQVTFAAPLIALTADVLTSKLSATGTIPDDENCQITVSNDTAIEGSVLTFVISSTHVLDPSVNVDYTTAGSLTGVAAVAGENYQPASGTVTLGATRTASLQVVSEDNSVLEGDLTFVVDAAVAVSEASLYPSVGAGQGLGVVEDDYEDATISVTMPAAGQEALRPQLRFTMQLSHETRQPLVVQYETVNGTAVSGEDFAYQTGTKTFFGVPGTGATVTVDVENDNIVEPQQTFDLKLDLLEPAWPVTFVPSSVYGSIDDNEGASISIDSNDGAETNVRSVIDFTVHLSHSLEGSFSVLYTTESGSAKGCPSPQDTECQGFDYLSSTGVLTFGSSPEPDSMEIVQVVLVNDRVSESDETFSLVLEDSALGDEGVSQTNAEYSVFDFMSGYGTIHDNEAATLSIQGLTTTEVAPEGEDMKTITLTVHMSHASEPVVEVSWVTFEGSATQVDDEIAYTNIDYVHASGSVIFDGAFDAGATNIQTSTLELQVVDDAIQEADEEFCVSLVAIIQPDGLQRVVSIPESGRNGMIHLIDDDEFVTLSIEAQVARDEGERSTIASFAVALSHGVQASDVMVDWQTTPGTAIPEMDYLEADGTISFYRTIVEGQQFREIDVRILPDSISEEVETFWVNLTQVYGPPLDSGNAGPAEEVTFIEVTRSASLGQITNNANSDNATVSIDDSSAEESATEMIFTVHLSHQVSTPVTVMWSAVADTAHFRNPADFRQPPEASRVLVFDPTMEPSGVNMGIEQTLSVPIIDDVVVQADHDFLVHIEVDGNAIVAKGQAVGTIEDNDISEAMIMNSMAAEEEGSTMVFTATLTKQVAANVTFSWSTRDLDSAAFDLDYEQVIDHDAHWPPLENTTYLEVQVLNDPLQEGDETFLVVADPIEVGRVGFADKVVWADGQGTAVGTITDDEDVTVTISDVEVTEDQGIFRFSVLLSHRIVVESSVQFDVQGVTAGPQDYHVVNPVEPGPIDLASEGNRFSNAPPPSKVVLLEIDEDPISEQEDEVLLFNLLPDTKTGPFRIVRDTATITIMDNDFATISIEDVSAEETEGSFVFTATLSHPVARAVGYEWRTVSACEFDCEPGQAFGYLSAAGVVPVGTSQLFQPDFQLVENGQGVFEAEQLTSTMVVPVFDDTEQECEESFQVEIHSVDIPMQGLPALAVGKLVNDNEGAYVVVTDVEQEEGQPFVFEISTSHALSEDVTLTWSTLDCTFPCVPGSDSVTLLKHSGSQTLAAEVIVRNEDTVEPTQTFAIEIALDDTEFCQEGYLAAGSPGMARILDDDSATLVVSDFSAPESDGMFPVTVTLSTPATVEITVEYTVDLTSTSNSAVQEDFDSSQMEGVVVFQAGETVKTIDLAISRDDLVEADETFRVSVSVVGEYADLVEVRQETATVTIINSDVAVISLAPEPTPSEGTGEWRFTVTLDKAVDSNLELLYQPVTALADVAPDVQTILIPAGETGPLEGMISLENDNIVEGDETFRVQVVLVGMSNSRPVTFSGGRQFLTGAIEDDDQATVEIAIDSTISETDDYLEFEVTLSAQVDAVVEVRYSVRATQGANSAIAGQDYRVESNGVLVFRRFDTSPKRGLVRVFDNSACNANREFILVLEVDSGDRDVVFQNDQQTYEINAEIVNDDFPVVSISDASTTAGETIAFEVTLSQTCDYELSFEYQLQTQQAAEYVVDPAGVLVIAANSMTADVQMITLDALQRDIRFLPVEVLPLGQVSGSSATGTILPVEVQSRLTFSEPVYTESQGFTEFFVQLDPPRDESTTFIFRTSPISAISGVHYTGVKFQGEIPAGEVVWTYSVMGAHDNVVIPPGATFAAEISTFDEDVLGGVLTAQAMLEERNLPVLCPLYSGPSVSVYGGDIAVIDISLEEQTGYVTCTDQECPDLMCRATTQDGTAEAGRDYEAEEALFRFSPIRDDATATYRSDEGEISIRTSPTAEQRSLTVAVRCRIGDGPEFAVGADFTVMIFETPVAAPSSLMDVCAPPFIVTIDGDTQTNQLYALSDGSVTFNVQDCFSSFGEDLTFSFSEGDFDVEQLQDVGTFAVSELSASTTITLSAISEGIEISSIEVALLLPPVIPSETLIGFTFDLVEGEPELLEFIEFPEALDGCDGQECCSASGSSVQLSCTVVNNRVLTRIVAVAPGVSTLCFGNDLCVQATVAPRVPEVIIFDQAFSPGIDVEVYFPLPTHGSGREYKFSWATPDFVPDGEVTVEKMMFGAPNVDGQEDSLIKMSLPTSVSAAGSGRVSLVIQLVTAEEPYTILSMNTVKFQLIAF